MTRKVGVLTVCDRCSRGEALDISGPLAVELLLKAGYEVVLTGCVPDERRLIAETLSAWAGKCDLIITTGGTGLAERDVTPEATKDVVDRDVPGLAEVLRWTGYRRSPRAILSRGVAGLAGRTLIVNLPGSQGGVRDGLRVLLRVLGHALDVAAGRPLDH